jgi:hypothetical protein
MITKCLEIRDEGTCIAAIAMKMTAANPVEDKFFWRVGYPRDGHAVVLMNLSDQKASSDPYAACWGGTRTMALAHNWIIDHFDELTEGQVVDVRVIMGWAEKPARAEIMVPRHPNGAPMYAPDGMMLDEHGNRSVFDDVDQ